MKKVIENIKFMQEGTMVFGDLYMEDGVVQRIDYKTPHMLSDIVIPGFVDIHTHGFHGYSCDDSDPKRLLQLAQEYAKRGVTTFCPTLSARPLKEYAAIIDVYRKAYQGDIHKGARYGGVHLEGPYLQPEMAGAMEKAQLQRIDIGELDDFLREYHNDIRIMTIAPELPFADEAIRILHLYGVEVALGHTNATFTQAREAFALGAGHVTHLGNTMPRIDHHHENMMDAVFLSDCICEIIMDGVHMQPRMLEWIIRLLGCKRIIAISDGTPYSGYTYPEGYELEGGYKVKNQAIFKGEELIASCCDLLSIFQFLYQHYDLMECIQMCCGNAAKMLKTYTCEIGLGKKADIVLLDHELHIKDVIVNGRSVN